MKRILLLLALSISCLIGCKEMVKEKVQDPLKKAKEVAAQANAATEAQEKQAKVIEDEVADSDGE